MARITLLLACAAPLLLSGCGTPQEWAKAGTPRQLAIADLQTCKSNAAAQAKLESGPELSGSDFLSPGQIEHQRQTQEPIIAAELAESCMEAKGYSLVEVAQSPADETKNQTTPLQ